MDMVSRPASRVTQFLAVDGEGLTRADGQHDYVTLQASDNTMVEQWERGGLSTAECFDFLLDLHVRNPQAALVSFAFGYDVNMVLRNAPREVLERMNSGEYTMYDRRYLCKFIAGKSFYVGRGHLEAGKWVTDVGVTVWDTWGFFQSTFVRAIAEWEVCPTETIEIISKMKDRRGEFTDEMRSLIVSYCFRECELLVRLMDELKTVADAADIRLSRWDGAGACASALLRLHIMKGEIHASRDVSDDVARAALYAYYGGRIEIAGSGVIPDTCYEYDINSAYPAEIAELPSMFGAWEYCGGASVGPNGIYQVAWDMPADSLIGPLPWRTADGDIIYPLTGRGYYHAAEVRAALDCFGDSIFVVDGWEFTPTDEAVKPFDWIHDLYQQRRVYKESGDARAIVLKLALNAMYGKLAQSVGYDKHKAPAYQSYYLAGRVTAGTRAKLLRAAVAAGDSLISTMTDALFTRKQLDLPLSKELGEWDETIIDPGLLVVQPGVSLTPSTPCDDCEGVGCHNCSNGEHMAYGRSRGFQRSSLSYERALSAWREGGMHGAFTVTERRFIGMGRALAYAKLAEWHLDKDPERDILGNLISEQWRRWVEIEKRVSYSANLKRKATMHDLYEDWISWWPPDRPISAATPRYPLGAIYQPKTVYRVVHSISDTDAAENHGVEGFGVGV